MEQTDHTEELKKVRIALVLNLLASIFALFEFFLAMNSNVTWRMICAGVGSFGFLFLTVAIFVRLRKVQKAAKTNSL
jgi:hypothetical protein